MSARLTTLSMSAMFAMSAMSAMFAMPAIFAMFAMPAVLAMPVMSPMLGARSCVEPFGVGSMLRLLYELDEIAGVGDETRL
jgi:hypothetical protein